MKPLSQIPYDELLLGKRNAKLLRGEEVKPRAKPTHQEADLHLAFCKWVKKEYPHLQFVRHEREKQRSAYMQNLMRCYNSDIDKLPDFELLDRSGSLKIGWYNEPGKGLVYYSPNMAQQIYYGLYIEFKRPSRTWVNRDNSIRSDCKAQYATHCHLWSIGRCAYFCNDLEDAKAILRDYLAGSPKPKQNYLIKE